MSHYPAGRDSSFSLPVIRCSQQLRRYHQHSSNSTKMIPTLVSTAKPGPRPVLWINGFPGTGKLTIARELARIHIPSILIDNHQLIDPVAAKFSRDHPRYQIERKRRRAWAFENFVLEPIKLSEAIIFTGRVSNSLVNVDM